MDPVNLIGITGYAQHGKSTCARRLVEMGWYLVPFASVLKQMLIAFGVPPATVYGPDKELPLDILCGKTARYAMQTLGTEWGRDIIGQDVWIQAWKAKVELALEAGAMVVVDDIRFPNEAEAVGDMGGLVIRVDRPGKKVDATHTSEELLNDIAPDHFIYNTHTLAYLRDQISVFGVGL